MTTMTTKAMKLAGAVLGLLLWGAAHAGTVTYVYTDPQGTPLMETDAAGNITARFEYTPYGVSVPSMGAAPNGVGYTGHVNDPETGLLYMQARYYDAEVGRFLSVDPVELAPGDGFNFNRYTYANNNPYKFTDPDGRAVQALWGAPVGFVVEIAAQKIANPGAPINWKSVGVSTLVGAATGGIGSVARVAAVRGTISVSQAVTRTALANGAVSAAGSAADSSVNGEKPSAVKMGAAAVLGGTLSYGAGRRANVEAITLQKMASAPVTSPQAIGSHIAATTQSAGTTAATQSAASVVAENGADVAGAAVQKKIEERIDRNK